MAIDDRDALESLARAYAQDVHGMDEPDDRCYEVARTLLAVARALLAGAPEQPESWYVVEATVPCVVEVRVTARSQREAEEQGERLIRAATLTGMWHVTTSVVASRDGHVVRLVPDVAEFRDIRSAPTDGPSPD